MRKTTVQHNWLHFYISPKIVCYALLAFFLGSIIVRTQEIKDSSRIGYPYNYVKFEAYKPGTPILRVARPHVENTPKAFSAYGPGMDLELFQRFLTGHDYKIRWIYVDNCDEALKLVQKGRCDLVIGFGGLLSPHLSPYIAQSPVLGTFHPVWVEAPGGGDDEFFNIAKSGMKRLTLANPNKDKGKSNRFLMDPATYALMVPTHKGLRTRGTLDHSVGYRWFWHQKNYDLAKKMNKFWHDQETRTLVAEMNDRYYGFIPEKPKHWALKELARIVGNKFENYSEAIIKASEATGVDPLLIAAVIFQESRFRSDAVSFTGVRGIMQLTSATAALMNVDRLNPEQCILGGARYLKYIWDSLEGYDIAEWDRWSLTLAAYNQGPGIMRLAVKHAQATNTPLKWTELRDIYLRLKPEGKLGRHYRAYEAVDYVDSVRYYYFVLSGLAEIAGPEQEHLAVLLSFASERP